MLLKHEHLTYTKLNLEYPRLMFVAECINVHKVLILEETGSFFLQVVQYILHSNVSF